MAGDGPERQEGVPGVRLLVIGKDSYDTFDLPAFGMATIGRAESCDIRLNDPQASRSHAVLRVEDGLSLEDLGSINGTRVRDRPIGRGERVTVHSGDTIVIGTSVLIVHVRSKDQASSALAESPTFSDGSLEVLPSGNPGGAMQGVYRLAEKAAAGTINVLILGETGVGKEVMAATLHQLSPRRAGPYVCVNCATLSSETLLESELFGHEKGSFTGATSTKVGLIETAAGGTLFLDELGELPLNTQAKLLRTIDTKEFTRIGSVRPKRIDVRFIAATNRNLTECIEKGTFRADLFYRLNSVTIEIPPLRERRAEILPLAKTFLENICRDLGREAPRISPMVVAWLERQPWDGNIRELKNVIERAVLLCAGPEIGLDDMPQARPAARLKSTAGAREPDSSSPTDPTDLTHRSRAAPLPAETGTGMGGAQSGLEASEVSKVQTFRGHSRAITGEHEALSRRPAGVRALTADGLNSEKQRMEAALLQHAGNQTKAAESMGMPRRTFVQKLVRYGIPRPKSGPSE